jgi:hypothetical protein
VVARPEITGRDVSTGPAPEPSPFLTEQQLAGRWQVSEYTLYEARRQGRGCRFLLVGKSAIRYALSAVEEFERDETFQSMIEVYSRRSGRARARAEHRKQLTKARAVLAEGKRT